MSTLYLTYKHAFQNYAIIPSVKTAATATTGNAGAESATNAAIHDRSFRRDEKRSQRRGVQTSRSVWSAAASAPLSPAMDMLKPPVIVARITCRVEAERRRVKLRQAWSSFVKPEKNIFTDAQKYRTIAQKPLFLGFFIVQKPQQKRKNPG